MDLWIIRPSLKALYYLQYVRISTEDIYISRHNLNLWISQPQDDVSTLQQQNSTGKYANETCHSTGTIFKRPDVFRQWYLKQILKITFSDQAKYEAFLHWTILQRFFEI